MFRQFGLGVKKSTCDGPPCMNSEIMAVAFGAKWGAAGLRSSGRFSPGFLAISASSSVLASRSARANAPMPKAVSARKSRRLWKGGSVDIEELVGMRSCWQRFVKTASSRSGTGWSELAGAELVDPCRLFACDRALVNETPGAWPRPGERSGAGACGRVSRTRPGQASGVAQNEIAVHEHERLRGRRARGAAVAVDGHRRASRMREQRNRFRAADLQVKAAPRRVFVGQTWPTVSSATGTGGPNSVRSRRPLRWRTTSRISSASSRRSGKVAVKRVARSRPRRMPTGRDARIGDKSSDVMISRCIRFRHQPGGRAHRPASRAIPDGSAGCQARRSRRAYRLSHGRNDAARSVHQHPATRGCAVDQVAGIREPAARGGQRCPSQGLEREPVGRGDGQVARPTDASAGGGRRDGRVSSGQTPGTSSSTLTKSSTGFSARLAATSRFSFFRSSAAAGSYW